MNYAIIYRPGSHWIAGIPAEQQNLGAHKSYINQLRGQRKITQDSPFLDDMKVTVLDVDSEIEARDIMTHDPAVMLSLLQPELTFWSIVFGVHSDRCLPTRA